MASKLTRSRAGSVILVKDHSENGASGNPKAPRINSSAFIDTALSASILAGSKNLTGTCLNIEGSGRLEGKEIRRVLMA